MEIPFWLHLERAFKVEWKEFEIHLNETWYLDIIPVSFPFP